MHPYGELHPFYFEQRISLPNSTEVMPTYPEERYPDVVEPMYHTQTYRNASEINYDVEFHSSREPSNDDVALSDYIGQQETSIENYLEFVDNARGEREEHVLPGTEEFREHLKPEEFLEEYERFMSAGRNEK